MLIRLPNRQWTEEQRRLALHRAYSLILSWPVQEAACQVDVALDPKANHPNLAGRPFADTAKPLMPAVAANRRTVRDASVAAGVSEKAPEPSLEDESAAGALEADDRDELR
jgi:hypothetical protein